MIGEGGCDMLLAMAIRCNPVLDCADSTTTMSAAAAAQPHSASLSNAGASNDFVSMLGIPIQPGGAIAALENESPH
jgi:hypothetical protein